MPFLSCIVLSHNKEATVGQALDSLLAQTFPDWEAIVFDSGVLLDRGFFDTLPALKDPRFRLVRSWETEELRQTRTIASWCFNECFRQGLVRGDYVMYLCDDDFYYPGAFQAFADHVRVNPGVLAMYGSLDLTGANPQGDTFPIGELLAEEVKGSCVGGGPLDYHVDGMQLCHKAELFHLFPDDEFWPEDRALIRHADGVFLEKIGRRVPIYPVPVKIGQNRKVPQSLNDGGERLELLRGIYHLRQEVKQLHQAVNTLRDENTCLREILARHEADNVRLQVALAGYQGRLRYRLADKMNSALKRVPLVHGLSKRLLRAGRKAWQLARGKTG
jgi:glycosyltransferase involved in cell wall biosynthesis